MEPSPNNEAARNVRIALGEGKSLSGLVNEASSARACDVMAHGAGAGMTHPFLGSMAAGLAERGITTVRYQFPSMEAGSRRPDVPAVAHAAVRAAVEEASRLAQNLPIFAGGKSFGARMTSQAQVKSPLAGVRGLVFLGFPLHPPGKPSDERAKHLFDVHIPMLFLQGSRDEFADLKLLEPLVARLGTRATLKLFPEADHSFHVLKRSGRTDAEVRAEMCDAIAQWIDDVLKPTTT